MKVFRAFSIVLLSAFSSGHLLAEAAEKPKEVTCYVTSDANNTQSKLSFKMKRQRNQKYTVTWYRGEYSASAKDMECEFPSKKVPYATNCTGPVWEEANDYGHEPLTKTNLEVSEEVCIYNGKDKRSTVTVSLGRSVENGTKRVGDFFQYYNQGDDIGQGCMVHPGYFGYCTAK